jgi:hypothetical protein
LFGFDADRIVEPALDEVNVKLAVYQDETISVRAIAVFHAREDGSAALALRENPGADGELVKEAEITHVARIDERLAVKDLGVAIDPGAARGIVRHAQDGVGGGIVHRLKSQRQARLQASLKGPIDRIESVYGLLPYGLRLL